MSAPLKLRVLAPIYALSGSPHPDAPQVPAGKAARTEAENARLFPRSGPAPPASPSRRRFRLRPVRDDRHELFSILDVAVEVTPKGARFRPKIREEIL